MQKLQIILIIISMSLLFISCDKQNDSLSNSETDIIQSNTETSADPIIVGEQTTVTSAQVNDSVENSQFEQNTTTASANQTSVVAATTTTIVTTLPAPITKKVTITEGLSFTQIAKLLDENGICDRQKLLDTVNTYDYSYYSLIGAIGNSDTRCYKLEGYLYPDTYEFYIDEVPENVLGKFLRNTENKITNEYRQRASTLGYSMDQVITLASIIEKEIGDHNQMKTVSSVFYNRLKSGQKLQCDSSINYIEWYVKPYLSGDVNRYNAYYNTYKCSALPSGPICNPGKQAIEAALYPDTTDYLYFASDTSGNYYYAKTYEEHLENCRNAGIAIE